MHDALLPFADQIRGGVVPNHKIAKWAKNDLTAADVAAARVELQAAEKPAEDAPPVGEIVQGVADDVGEVARLVEGVAEAVAAEVPAVAPVASAVALVADAVADIAEAVADGPPSHVRMTRTVRAPGPDRKPRNFGFRGIYKGDLAAWLWKHHRDAVEAFPVKR